MIGIAIDSAERLVYFSNVIRSLPSVRFIILSDQPIARLLKILKNVEAVSISTKTNAQVSADWVDCTDLVEFHREKASNEELNSRRFALKQALEKLTSKYEIEQFLVWNGQTLVSKSVADNCKELGIDCLFLELGNYGEKIFADPEGVNKNSALANGKVKIPEISEKDRLANIVENIKLIKRKPPKQSRRNFAFSLLRIANRLMETPNPIFWGRLLERQNSTFPEFPNDLCMPSQYIFVPLQVSNDTQLLLNSKFDNFDLLDTSLSQADQLNISIVVKIHPAERDQSFINKVVRFKNEHPEKVFLSTADTVSLIEKSLKVITVNSTVGVEAILYNIPVETLSPTFYTSLNRAQLVWYFENYLVSGCSYFSFERHPQSVDLERFLRT